MKHGKQWTGIAAVLGMTVLILDSKTAIMGASQGIRLCIGTVVPAIFPFLLLSNQIISAFSGDKILQPFARLFHFPPEAAPILIPGFLGGYPVGAQCIAKEYSADGILYEQVKFCDPWAYDRMLGSHIMRNEYGYPVLSIDRPYTVSGVGQLRTRIQAFIESVEIKKIHGGS